MDSAPEADLAEVIIPRKPHLQLQGFTSEVSMSRIIHINGTLTGYLLDIFLFILLINRNIFSSWFQFMLWTNTKRLVIDAENVFYYVGNVIITKTKTYK